MLVLKAEFVQRLIFAIKKGAKLLRHLISKNAAGKCGAELLFC
jgi:hypothetical protein